MTASGPDRYRVIARDAAVETEERRSRFLATVRRVGDEAAARAVVEECRRTHHDAGHHCSAFVLGPTAEVARSSDDGEPAGTAGVPMLEVLKGHDLSDVVAVVTRWFGGVKLGAGGLVRAYGDAVSTALARAGTRERVRMALAELDVDHADIGRLETDLRARVDRLGGHVTGVRWGSHAVVELALPRPGWSDAEHLVAELTAGVGVLRRTGEDWRDA